MKYLSFVISLILATSSIGQVSGLKSNYTAGENIKFTYQDSCSTLMLIVSHSYGTYVQTGQISENKTTFSIPQEISRKKGALHFTITERAQPVWKGETKIFPRTNGAQNIEAYCGPKHLVVGQNDFSMVTATVLDEFDNPLPKGTPVVVSTLIDSKQTSEEVRTNEFLAFNKVYAADKSGYGAIYAGYQQVSSKEFRLDFYANDPNAFSLNAKRQHEYADGLQLVIIETSVIKDRLGNQMEDGTLVSFEITDSSNQKTIAYASTINGKAKIELPAPSFPTNWNVQGDIATYAKSNIATLSFKSALQSIPIELSTKSLKVGPLKSYMGQLVKEGMLVNITLKNANREAIYTIATEQGVAILDYKKQMLQSGSYNATIKVGGITKSVKLEVENE